MHHTFAFVSEIGWDICIARKRIPEFANEQHFKGQLVGCLYLVRAFPECYYEFFK